MPEQQFIDHLFRHQYGVLVSILTRTYGLHNLELVEDVVQDTFIKALSSWRKEMPDNPEAWLTRVAKNRAIDVLRKKKVDEDRDRNYSDFPHDVEEAEVYLDHEINDNQLRMIFTACHPFLKPKEQITFALKTISGFSIKEIAASLLTKEDTVKKNISRSRKTLKDNNIQFEIPKGKDLLERIDRVHDIIYLIFNEGFHSTKKTTLVQKDLCFEAMRLCKILLQKGLETQKTTQALFALMCFHAARFDSKTDQNGNLVPISKQDRSLWHQPLIELANQTMFSAIKVPAYTSYHYEAAIAAEHIMARSFDQTDWNQILEWYQALLTIKPSDLTRLNMAVVLFKTKQYPLFEKTIDQIDPIKLEQRSYLYYTLLSDYYAEIGDPKKGLSALRQAINLVKNDSERSFLNEKQATFSQ